MKQINIAIYNGKNQTRKVQIDLLNNTIFDIGKSGKPLKTKKKKVSALSMHIKNENDVTSEKLEKGFNKQVIESIIQKVKG